MYGRKWSIASIICFFRYYYFYYFALYRYVLLLRRPTLLDCWGITAGSQADIMESSWILLPSLRCCFNLQASSGQGFFFRITGKCSDTLMTIDKETSGHNRCDPKGIIKIMIASRQNFVENCRDSIATSLQERRPIPVIVGYTTTSGSTVRSTRGRHVNQPVTTTYAAAATEASYGTY